MNAELLAALADMESWTEVHIELDRASLGELQEYARKLELLQSATRIHIRAKTLENGI